MQIGHRGGLLGGSASAPSSRLGRLRGGVGPASSCSTRGRPFRPPTQGGSRSAGDLLAFVLPAPAPEDGVTVIALRLVAARPRGRDGLDEGIVRPSTSSGLGAWPFRPCRMRTGCTRRRRSDSIASAFSIAPPYGAAATAARLSCTHVRGAGLPSRRERRGDGRCEALDGKARGARASWGKAMRARVTGHGLIPPHSGARTAVEWTRARPPVKPTDSVRPMEGQNR